MHITSTSVSTLSQNHLLYTDPTLSRQIQNLAVDRGDLNFLKYLVNNLHVDIDGEHCGNDIHYLDGRTRTHIMVYVHAQV